MMHTGALGTDRTENTYSERQTRSDQEDAQSKKTRNRRQNPCGRSNRGEHPRRKKDPQILSRNTISLPPLIFNILEHGTTKSCRNPKEGDRGIVIECRGNQKFTKGLRCQSSRGSRATSLLSNLSFASGHARENSRAESLRSPRTPLVGKCQKGSAGERH